MFLNDFKLELLKRLPQFNSESTAVLKESYLELLID